MNKDEFIAAYNQFAGQALALCEKSRREGLLSLEETLETMADPFLKRGLRLAVDGTAPAFIEKILSNLIAQEKDEYGRTLKTIKKEAVIAVQSGVNPLLLLNLLNSYTDIPFDADEILSGITGVMSITAGASTDDGGESEANYEHDEGRYDGEA